MTKINQNFYRDKTCIAISDKRCNTRPALLLWLTHPLFMTGGEVGDRDGHALLTGGGSVAEEGGRGGGGGSGGESGSSSSEELSSVRSITSNFLLWLLSLWLEDEELC